jgi:hypothetical protein
MLPMTHTDLDDNRGSPDKTSVERSTTGRNTASHEVGGHRALAGFDVARDIDGTPLEVEANRRGQVSGIGVEAAG